MARELAISLYLFVFKCVFFIFNQLPLKNKTTFVISFGDNSQYIFEEMKRQNIQTEVVFLCKGTSLNKFNDYHGVKTIPFETLHLLDWFKSVYHLATSRNILIDNYFGFLASIQFKAGVECIQLWHASGAMKKFGLEDESIKNRSNRANQRFLQVYSRFNKVIVGSEVMADVFKKSFNLKEKNILRTGIPRTDFFYNQEIKHKVLEKFAQKHPELIGKKVILYAPTYRDDEINDFSLKLDVEKMQRALGNEYIVILRLHPAIRNSIDIGRGPAGFLFDFSSDEYEINELLIVSDILITDYSSIPFEYSLLQRPMIFFTYDLEEYKVKRGVLKGFEDNLPGPIVKDTDSIIELIKQNSFDLDKVAYYAELWNKYSKGYSSAKMVHYMFLEKSPQAFQETSAYS
ncbi:CDP-glycerol glycerophosphotransferase family protein [Neobacillus kokaensis]|uniref:CDP-glycerol--glycerophosphate glycerophosphotransferase n=1 Tax=Neobacillus kokaensis TaxID=2759023 RepID=A0ABQ3N1R8_9BACI|nr:CDP-glycerol glycerophosphotransferase family protein [Neobacillus kokaensis]GHH97458.1 hypothetical protein AM1BK_10010 [Neobacillus kokaensis]